MRIGILTTSFPRFDGDEAGIFVERLVLALSAAGASGPVIVPKDSEEPVHSKVGEFSVTRFRYGIFSKGALAFGSGIMPNIRANPLRILQAPNLLLQMAVALWRRRREYDVIQANWAASSIPAWIVSLLTGKKYIVTLRGEDLRLLRSTIAKILITPALKSASKIVVVSEQLKDDLVQNFKISPSCVSCIPNGVSPVPVTIDEIKKFKAEFNIISARHYALFAGTHIPRKRVELLIDLIADNSLSDYLLLLCGRIQDESYLSILRERVRDRSVESRVQFLGPVSPKNMAAAYGLTDIYLTASEYEGRPNSVLEAMASGVPVCASDIDAHRLLLKDGAGFLFDPTNLAAAVNYIRSLDLPAKRNQVILAGKAAVAEFSWEGAAKAYLELFTSICQ